MAATGGTGTGEDDVDRRIAATYKTLSKVKRGHQPRASTLDKLLTNLRTAGLDRIKKAPGYSEAAADHLIKRLDAAVGPFVSLSIQFVPFSRNLAANHLLDFAQRLDQLGASYNAATDANDLEAAKHLFLDPNWLDEAYWSWPDPGQEDPRRNRETLSLAANWEELTRAASPLIINCTLSWLSCLDLSVLSNGRDHAARFPLFLPLATRFTPKARSAIQAGQPPPAAKWSDCFELPIPNLIRVLKHITEEITQNIQKRAKPPKRRYASKGDREKLSTMLKEISRHDMLSCIQFTKLMCALEPTPGIDLQDGEGYGFDVRALLLAANLFSLMTPRDGKPPTNKTRLNRPQSITIFGDIPDAYAGWWRRNLTEGTGETCESPRPAWFSQSLAETAQTDRPD